MIEEIKNSTTNQLNLLKQYYEQCIKSFKDQSEQSKEDLEKRLNQIIANKDKLLNELK